MTEITYAHLDALAHVCHALEAEQADDVALYMRLVGHYRNGRVPASSVQSTADRINRRRERQETLRDLSRKLHVLAA